MKGKHLSKQHKQKISRALKGRGRGRQKPTLEGHVVKGVKIGATLGGGLNALGGTLIGGALGGPPGAVIGGLGYGAAGALGGGVSGAGYGAAVYGARRLLSRKKKAKARYSNGNRLAKFGSSQSHLFTIAGVEAALRTGQLATL